MYKLALFIVILMVVISGCKPTVRFEGNTNTPPPKPEKSIFTVGEQNGKKMFFLDGKAITEFLPPKVIIDTSKNTFTVDNNINFLPGREKTGPAFDGFTFYCNGPIYSEAALLKIKVGIEGGEIPIPTSPYDHCGIVGYIKNDRGDKIETEEYLIRFKELIIKHK